MRKTLLLTALLCLASSPVFSANVDAEFNGATGTLTLPQLIVDGQVFYVTLSLIDPATLTLQVNLDAAVDITPTEATATTLESDLWGTWTEADVGVDKLRLTFNSDGSYSVFSDNVDDCNGEEIGTYAWEPSTGVFIASQSLDTDGECGVSDPRGSDLIFIDGNNMTIQETGVDGETFNLVRVS